MALGLFSGPVQASSWSSSVVDMCTCESKRRLSNSFEYGCGESLDVQIVVSIGPWPCVMEMRMKKERKMSLDAAGMMGSPGFLFLDLHVWEPQ